MAPRRLALHGLDPQIAATYTYPLPGAWCWLAIAGVVTGYDLWAELHHKPTASATFGHYAARPVAGPVVVGAGCGLIYHLWQETRSALRHT